MSFWVTNNFRVAYFESSGCKNRFYSKIIEKKIRKIDLEKIHFLDFVMCIIELEQFKTITCLVDTLTFLTHKVYYLGNFQKMPIFVVGGIVKKELPKTPLFQYRKTYLWLSE